MDENGEQVSVEEPNKSTDPIIKSRSLKKPSSPGSDVVVMDEVLPNHLMLLPVAQTTLFPGMIIPLILPEGKLTKTIDHVIENSGFLGILLGKQINQDVATGPSTSMTGLPADGTVPTKTVKSVDQNKDLFYPYGVAAKVLKKINLPDNQISVLLTGLQRFKMNELSGHEPFYHADVKYLFDQVTRGVELEALLRSALSQFKQISKDNPLISEEVKVALVNIDGPGKLADLMASVLVRDVEDYQKLLSLSDINERLQYLLLLLKKELDVQTVQKKIQDEISQKISHAQKEFYLQEQLKLIEKELGRYRDDRSKILLKFKERLKLKTLPEEAKKRIDEEMEKLSSIHEQSSEYSVCLNYLDWATSLPWGIRSEENHNLTRAKKVLDEDHYGLKEVKERILEFLAVKILKQSNEGSILCFVGPPGTGKTSVGRSIARVLNRKFFRFSVGGMRDEAEIKGHRRTYVGAMPGKMIQGLKRVETQNPVFLIDEIDKIGTGFASGGDPASSLLELLDQEQNSEFLDHYLDIPFNCSEVFFVTTANMTDTIPPALLDRMEVIPLHGYTDNEKYHIAKQFLIPKLLKKNALTPKSILIKDRAIKHIIASYAREAGVRNLEKQLSKVFRKTAYQIATRRSQKIMIDISNIEKYLGPRAFEPEKEFMTSHIPGMATGLAWTQYGGEVLSIECISVDGKGGLLLTGSMGDVMQESANIAFSYVRDHAKELNLPKTYFDKKVFHMHIPAGSTPKDGPSAGVTMVASLYSLISQKKIKPLIAMTGEITLKGRVLPVGGIKEKLLAAKRAGIQTVLLPKQNHKDLKKVESEIKAGLKIIEMDTLAKFLKQIF